ncbi:TetR family transcriptional regulator [Endozoicomonadaceae bacterium StTr2]
MARKTREAAEQTRKLLLDTALQLFDQQGIHHTTLAQIAKAAGVTRGAIYWHFKDRDDLFRTLWEEISAPILQRFDEIKELPGEDKFNAMLELVIRFVGELTSDSKLQQMHRISIQAEAIPTLHQWLKEDMCKDLTGITELMQEAQQLNQVRNDITASQAASFFYGYVDGLIRNWLQFNLPQDLRENLPLYINLGADSLRPAKTG